MPKWVKENEELVHPQAEFDAVKRSKLTEIRLQRERTKACWHCKETYYQPPSEQSLFCSPECEQKHKYTDSEMRFIRKQFPKIWQRIIITLPILQRLIFAMSRSVSVLSVLTAASMFISSVRPEWARLQ